MTKIAAHINRHLGPDAPIHRELDAAQHYYDTSASLDWASVIAAFNSTIARATESLSGDQAAHPEVITATHLAQFIMLCTQYLHQLESAETTVATLVNASDERTYVRNFKEHPSIAALHEHLQRDTPEALASVKEHTKRLLSHAKELISKLYEHAVHKNVYSTVMHIIRVFNQKADYRHAESAKNANDVLRALCTYFRSIIAAESSILRNVLETDQAASIGDAESGVEYDDGDLKSAYEGYAKLGGLADDGNARLRSTGGDYSRAAVTAAAGGRYAAEDSSDSESDDDDRLGGRDLKSDSESESESESDSYGLGGGAASESDDSDDSDDRDDSDDSDNLGGVASFDADDGGNALLGGRYVNLGGVYVPEDLV